MRPRFLLAAALSISSSVWAAGIATVTHLGDSIDSPAMNRDAVVFWRASTDIRNENAVLVPAPPSDPDQLGHYPYGNLFGVSGADFLTLGSFRRQEDPGTIGNGIVSYRAVYLNAVTPFVHLGDRFPGVPRTTTVPVQPSACLFDSDGSLIFGIYYSSGTTRHEAICRREDPGAAIEILAHTGKTTAPGGGGKFTTLELLSVNNGVIIVSGRAGTKSGIYELAKGRAAKLVLDFRTELPGLEEPLPEDFTSFRAANEGSNVVIALTPGVFKRIGGVWSQVVAKDSPIPDNAGTFQRWINVALRGSRVSFIGATNGRSTDPFIGGAYTEDADGLETIFDNTHNFGATVTRVQSQATWSNGSKLALNLGSASWSRIYSFTYPPLPLAALDDNHIIRGESKTVVPVLANDLSGPAAGALQVTEVSAASAGTVKLKGNTVTYQPGRDFQGTDTFTYTVSDGVSTTTATVTVTNPFLDWGGSFSQLVTDSNGNAVGVLTAKISPSGVFTGSVQLNGRKLPLRGKTADDGVFRQTIGKDEGAVTVAFSLDLNAQQQARIAGTVTHGSTVYTLGSSVALATALPEGVQPGRYTILLPAEPNRDDIPRGTGWVTVQVSARGAFRMAGQLGDRTTFSRAFGIRADGTVPIYVPIYKRPAGELSGTLTFRSLATSDLDGLLRWRKPSQTPASPAFPVSIDATTSATGSFYRVPARNECPLVVSAIPRGQVSITDGEVEPVTIGAQISNGGRCPIDVPNPAAVALELQSRSGTFSGTFKSSPLTRATSFSGVVHQKLNIARGIFIGNDQTGTVTLTPQ